MLILGKMNSLFGVCEGLTPLIYGPMYSAVYRATMSIMPSLFYLVGGGFMIPAAVLFLYVVNMYTYKGTVKHGRS